MIKLRPYTETDADELVVIANNFNVAKYMTNRFAHPYTKENAVAFFESIKNDSPTRVFAVTVNDIIVGSTGIHFQEDVFVNNAEIGYWFGEPYWGKGYATETLKQISEYAFNNFPVNRLFCRIFGNNPKSMKVAEKVGYKLEAKFEKTLLKNGELLDEYIYAKRKI